MSKKILLVAIPIEAGNSGQPAGIFIGCVCREIMLFEISIELRDPILIQRQICSCIDLDNGMQALPARPGDALNRQVQF